MSAPGASSGHQLASGPCVRVKWRVLEGRQARLRGDPRNIVDAMREALEGAGDQSRLTTVNPGDSARLAQILAGKASRNHVA